MTNSLVKLTQESDYQGQYQRTIEFHEQRLRIAIERGDRAGESACLSNLGMIYHSLGAIQGFLEALLGKRFRGQQIASVLQGSTHDVLEYTLLV
jgi:hypothetical protein